MPAPARPPRPERPRFLLPLGAWLIVLGAFALGLLLFLAIWLGQREPADEAEAAALPTPGADPAPGRPSLPAPQQPPEDTDDDADDDGGLFVMPEAPQRPIEPPSPADAPLPAPTSPDVDGAVVATDSLPVPVRAPEPRYPRAALRRGEAGEVVIRVRVGTNGRPQDVEIARSSSYPSLDQAALDAVRRWRFEPAMRQGQPVAETVQIPVVFNPSG